MSPRTVRYQDKKRRLSTEILEYKKPDALLVSSTFSQDVTEDTSYRSVFLYRHCAL